MAYREGLKNSLERFSQVFEIEKPASDRNDLFVGLEELSKKLEKFLEWLGFINPTKDYSPENLFLLSWNFEYLIKRYRELFAKMFIRSPPIVV